MLTSLSSNPWASDAIRSGVGDASDSVRIRIGLTGAMKSPDNAVKSGARTERFEGRLSVGRAGSLTEASWKKAMRASCLCQPHIASRVYELPRPPPTPEPLFLLRIAALRVQASGLQDSSMDVWADCTSPPALLRSSMRRPIFCRR